MEKKISKLESRLSKLESQFDVDDQGAESIVSPSRANRGGASVIRNILCKLEKMKELEDRINTVEDAVEKEHQSSLQILDMLMEMEKKRQQVKVEQEIQFSASTSSTAPKLYNSPKERSARDNVKNRTRGNNSLIGNSSSGTTNTNRFRV